MRCDLVQSWPKARSPNSPRVRCEQKAVQFLLTWNGTNAVSVVARCKQHMIVGVATDSSVGRTDLKIISEQEAEVYSVHEE